MARSRRHLPDAQVVTRGRHEVLVRSCRVRDPHDLGGWVRMLLPININNHQSHAIYHQISLSLARAGRISTYVKGATLSKRSRAFVELDDADRIGVVLDEAADRQTERLVLRAPSNVVFTPRVSEQDL